MKTAAVVKTHFVFLFVLTIGTGTAAWAQGAKDVTLHESVTSTGMPMGGGGNTTATVYLSGNAMKRSSSDGTDTIIRFDGGKIITIDNKKKTYTEMSMQQIQEMLDKGSAELQQNAEAAEAMRKMMGQMATSFTVAKVGPGEPIAGYNTEKYAIKGPFEMEIWAAPDLKVPAAYYDFMKARTRPNPMFDMRKMYDEMKKIDGMSLKSVMTIKMMGREMNTTPVVTSVDKGPIPPATFQIPAGYKLVSEK